MLDTFDSETDFSDVGEDLLSDADQSCIVLEIQDTHDAETEDKHYVKTEVTVQPTTGPISIDPMAKSNNPQWNRMLVLL